MAGRDPRPASACSMKRVPLHTITSTTAGVRIEFEQFETPHAFCTRVLDRIGEADLDAADRLASIEEDRLGCPHGPAVRMSRTVVSPPPSLVRLY